MLLLKNYNNQVSKLEKIEIIHTNDIHSHFAEWTHIKNFIQERRKKNQAQGITTLVVDAGDFCDRYHPLTEATKSQANIQELNAAGVDFLTIGNNEGLGNTHEQLCQLYEHFQGTCVLSHVRDDQQQAALTWADPCALYTTKAGYTLAFLGATAAFPLSYGPLGWDFQEVIPALQVCYEQYKAQADVFILLSHLGRFEDEKIAQACPWLNLIIGGHTHHHYPKGRKVGSTLLTAAKKYGQYLGIIQLQLDGRTCELEAETLEINAEPQGETKQDATYKEGMKQLAQKVIAFCPKDLSASDLAQQTVNFLAQQAQRPVILNDGLFVTGLKKGQLTKAQWQEILPHPLHLMPVRLSGKELKRFLFEIDKSAHFLHKFALKGMGFRGKVFGDFVYSGLSKEKGRWLFLGEEIVNQQTYDFLTTDHYYFVPFFPTLAYAGEVHFLMDRFLRQVMIEQSPALMTYIETQLKERKR